MSLIFRQNGILAYCVYEVSDFIGKFYNVIALLELSLMLPWKREVLILHLYEALSIFRGRVRHVSRALIDFFDSFVGGMDFANVLKSV